MKKILSVALLLFAIHSGIAQDKKQIIGKWIFETMINKEMSESDRAAVNKQLSGLTMNFMADNKFTINFRGVEQSGTWTLKDKILTTISRKGDKYDIPILKFAKNQMTLMFKDTQIRVKR